MFNFFFFIHKYIFILKSFINTFYHEGLHFIIFVIMWLFGMLDSFPKIVITNHPKYEFNEDKIYFNNTHAHVEVKLIISKLSLILFILNSML